MLAVEIIRKKRDGKKLSKEEIEFFIDGFTRGEIPDYQMAAFLMAVYLKGMDFEETTYLTSAMMSSGEIIDLSFLDAPKVDKHSTGGVGDKISLILAPLVASMGVVVPMISGRALGHTGGTLDKLESIKGFRTDLNPSEFKDILERVGVAIIGQTERLVPADRGMYALRDTTATVESVPLISSSIMSKKLAEGIDGLVLDVKTGNGAFMSTYSRAKELAITMVEIGKRMGKGVVALITNMNEPLGYAVGNAPEVYEAVEVLKGGGPHDVRELVLELASYMLVLAGEFYSIEEAKVYAEQALDQGLAYKKWREMVEAQGGDPDYPESEEFIRTKYVEIIQAQEAGYLYSYRTRMIGLAAQVLGAGRKTVEDNVDPKVGIFLRKKVGDFVKEGEELFEIRGNSLEKIEEAKEFLFKSYELKNEKPEKEPLVYEVINEGG